MRLTRPTLSSTSLILLTSLFLLVALNRAFATRLLDATPGAGVGVMDVTMLAAVFVINIILLSMVVWPKVAKPALITVILVAAGVAYFMTHLGAVIDRHAIASVMESDAREAGEWLGPGLVLWVIGLGVIPALLIVWVEIRFQPFWRELRLRTLINVAAITSLCLAALPQTQTLSSLLRNHGELRHYANPYAVVQAVRGYIKHELAVPQGPPAALGVDARRLVSESSKPLLLMLVVGESARAQSFELNGYDRPTNPELSKQPLLSWFDVHACGTNTATSLPCMFSNLGQDHFEISKARQTENLLDVLRHAGFHIVWRDNNTGSKTIAERAIERDLAHSDDPDWCQDSGCWDEVLLEGLAEDLKPEGTDTVLVLHMLGSHGPAYSARYPREFAVFTPECRSAELGDCTPEEIRNAYDNSIRYSDHVLARAIDWLKTRTDYQTAMLFASDHGESTGEHGLFLHGAPRFMAPDEQTHVPVLAWLSPEYQRSQALDWTCAEQHQRREISHDYWFHTALGLSGTRTSAYRPELDLFYGCRDDGAQQVHQDTPPAAPPA